VLEHAGKSHNQFVSVAAEGGIGHAVLFALMLAWFALRLLRAPPSAPRTAGLAGLAFFVMLSLLHDPLFHAVMSQALALLVGASLGLALEKRSAQPSSEVVRTSPPTSAARAPSR
jgi:O-antigen ligase